MTARKNAGKRIVTFCFAIYLTVFLFSCPDEAREGVYSALLMCLETVIPALFPFFVLTGLLALAGTVAPAGKGFAVVSDRLFGLSPGGAYALLLGAVGGFPLGTKVICDMYSNGSVGRYEAETAAPLVTFCSPFFTLSVSKTVFGNARPGMIIYLSSVVCSLLILAVTSKKRRNNKGSTSFKSLPEKTAGLTDVVTASFGSIVTLCGIIVFFSCVGVSVVHFAERLGAGPTASVFISGVLELTKGVFSLGSVTDMRLKVMAFALFTSFGGISVIFQSSALMSKAGLSSKYFWLFRPVCGLASALLAYNLTVFLC